MRLFRKKIPSHQWGGYIAPLLEDMIAHDGIAALRTAVVVLDRSYNGLGATWSRDDSLASVPHDAGIAAYCYVKDADEFERTFSSLEAAFARGKTTEPDRRLFVDFLAQCVARKLEEVVYGCRHPNA